MAREILFKAKTRDCEKKWVEGYVFKSSSNFDNYIIYNADNDESYLVDINTLCQYTGLCDKNGNKIWENDVVDASKGWWDASGPAGHSSPIIKVEWDEGFCGFVPFADYDCDCGVYIASSEVEVIGNIFDNPELLGGADNG